MMPTPRLALLASLLLAAATPAAHAEVITENPSGPFTGPQGGYRMGQSVTTGAGGPWDHLTFSLFASGAVPYAIGTLYVLSQEYLGTPDNLSSSTAGYVADTSTITGGAWDFADAVTLQANTTYFFYGTTGLPLDQIRYSGDLYSGGNIYSAVNGTANFTAISGFDLRFKLQGDVATETPEPATAAILLTGLAPLLLRRPRRHGAPQPRGNQ